MTEAVPSPTDVVPSELPVVHCVHQANCSSLSTRSELTYQLGKSEGVNGAQFHLRIVGNTGKGMFNDDWIDGQRIDALVRGASCLTSRSLLALLPHKSVNNGGFLLAALRDLGLIRPNPENSRWHEAVPTTSFSSVVIAHMSSSEGAVEPKATRRKGKEA